MLEWAQQGLFAAKGDYGAAMLKFDRQGLIPAVIQDDITGEVLMLAFMNEEAFERTRQTGQTHFFSRSRNAIWHKGEQSGNVQEVRAIFVNCEENSLLIRVIQHGDAACHMGYRSCYYRRLLPDGSYETVAERVFDPEMVYGDGHAAEKKDSGDGSQFIGPLEGALRQLYAVYLYLKDHDLSEESNTSRLLQERSLSYLLARLADELEELAEVQSGEHVHTGRQPDTILESSQVQYWLLLLATTLNLPYDDFSPHRALIKGYDAGTTGGTGNEIEQQQNCLDLLASNEHSLIVQGMELGFALVGEACARAGISPLAPAEYDLEQMRRKGLIG
jgi:phosphoribosyl-AMP cyclohydrolase